MAGTWEKAFVAEIQLFDAEWADLLLILVQDLVVLEFRHRDDGETSTRRSRFGSAPGASAVREARMALLC